jgi:hypothetical protein
LPLSDDRLRAAFMALAEKWRREAKGISCGAPYTILRLADELEALLATHPKETP